jgi:NADPH-dependent 2,4-dienoyl-CoA reductase/sulfur reductase-like enzyme
VRVCVVGAGRAGAEAAREASLRGSKVTLIDSAEEPLPDWTDWPGLISRGAAEGRGHRTLPSEADLLLGTRVLAVRQGSAATSNGGAVSGDSFVIATGSCFDPPVFEGRGKPGVTVLDGPSKYSGLGRELGSVERAVVAGEGVRGMQVAERIAAAGRRVTLVVSFWQRRPPGGPAAEVLFDAARAMGVGVSCGRVGRALGATQLEAALVEGRVVPSDSLAFVPLRVPRVPPTTAALGKRGGVAVGPDMRTSVPSTLSAGGCAELTSGIPPSSTLEEEQRSTGRVSGANASGADLRVPATRRSVCSIFGLTWTSIGVGLAESRAAGLAAVSRRWDEWTSCTVVYERGRGVVMGLEVVEDASRPSPSLPSEVSRCTLKSLAYCPLGSSDISVVSETARQGLKEWSGC